MNKSNEGQSPAHFRFRLTHAVVIAALAAPGAWAQQLTATPGERIEVTGSSIKRIDAETALPVQILRRDDIDRIAAGTTEELLQHVSAITSAGGIFVAQANGTVTTSQSNVSLRALGATRTLILVNGRRVAVFGGTTSIAVDVNSIPIAAIERIEVLKDGASSLYGSDAVAGVINFILRKDYHGAEVTATYGEPTASGGGKDFKVDGFLGFGDLDKDRYNVMFGAGYEKRDAITGASRSFAHNIDVGRQRPLVHHRLPGQHPLGPTFAACRARRSRIAGPPASSRRSSSATRLPAPRAASRTAPSSTSPRAQERACDAERQLPPDRPFRRVRRERLDAQRVRIPHAAGADLGGDGAARHEPVHRVPQQPHQHAVPDAARGPAPLRHRGQHARAAAAVEPVLPDRRSWPPWACPPTSPSPSATATSPTASATRATARTNLPPGRGLEGHVGGWDFDSAFLYSESKAKSELLRAIRSTRRSCRSSIAASSTRSAHHGPAGHAAAAAGRASSTAPSTRRRHRPRAGTPSAPRISTDAGRPAVMALAANSARRNSPSLRRRRSRSATSRASAATSWAWTKRNVGSIYAESAMPILRNFDMDVGVRYDDYQNVGTTTNPKVSLRWSAHAAAAVARLLRHGLPCAVSHGSLHGAGHECYRQRHARLLRCPNLATGAPSDCNNQFPTLTGGNPSLSPRSRGPALLASCSSPCRRSPSAGIGSRSCSRTRS